MEERLEGIYKMWNVREGCGVRGGKLGGAVKSEGMRGNARRKR